MTDTPLHQTSEDFDPVFRQALKRLHRLTVISRWLVVLGLWATIGTASLWNLRASIQLLRDYFTWSAVRYGLLFHPWAAMGLGVCVGMTLSVLIWQSRNILFGLPQPEQQRLQQMLLQIRQQGKSHPLWKWLYRDRAR
jgi:hypothetical protein